MAMAEEGNPNVVDEEEKENKSKEGRNLLGSPTFKELENGRFKCIETGHEMTAKDKEPYSRSKRCRLGLIDSALSQKNPPLNMFKQDPLCRTKLICKLTGDTINKSEEHIWKHINGKRFLNKLEQKEAEKLTTNGTVLNEADKMQPKILNPRADGAKKEQKNGVGKIDSRAKKSRDNSNASEELDFWIPPVGSRWDFDDGEDRWGSDSDSELETDEGNVIEAADAEGSIESGELSMRTKRMSIEVGPSSFASRKKKSKTSASNPTDN
ncbi:hypothetical protein HHK36_029548 [Tetracentron sinense]|uniref:Surfeit locus protein 2 n=1 Tax=Tetracentron sinense TaxID=13715 RepID=A0A834YFD9_TETSI|nr:hypothetical protein HHK36_029548 [Tetracentron sinense]